MLKEETQLKNCAIRYTWSMEKIIFFNLFTFRYRIVLLSLALEVDSIQSKPAYRG